MENCPSCKLWLYRVFPFLRWWPMVTKDSLRADAIAAITGAMIVLPQGVAFATIAEDAKGHPECPQIRMVRVNGSIFFGAVDHVQGALLQIDEINPQQKTVLVAGSGINFVDVAGAEMLAQEAKRRKKMGGGLYFYRCKDSVYQLLHKGDYLTDIGEGGFFPAMSNITHGLYHTLDPEVCKTCKTRIFTECHGKVLPDGELWPESRPLST